MIKTIALRVENIENKDILMVMIRIMKIIISLIIKTIIMSIIIASSQINKNKNKL